MATVTEQTSDLNSSPVVGRPDFAERIESLKAGVTGAVSSAGGFTLLTLGNQLLQAQAVRLAALPTESNLAIGGSIAAFSGFLFGITYRYVIRQDHNPHLKSGAVLAFGLVRGLVQVECGLQAHLPLLSLAISAGESILLFAIARTGVDLTIQQGWVKPFTSNQSEMPY